MRADARLIDTGDHWAYACFVASSDAVPDPLAAAHAIQAQVRGLVLPDWPVFGLAGEADSGWLAGFGEGDEGVTAVRVDYRVPGSKELLVVQTEARRDATPSLAGLVALVQSLDDDTGEPLSVRRDDGQGASEYGRDDTVTVDGQTRVAKVHRSGSQTGCILLLPEVCVLIASRGVALGEMPLSRVTDLAPLHARRAALVDTLLSDLAAPDD
jgi:hypothetical protein